MNRARGILCAACGVVISAGALASDPPKAAGVPERAQDLVCGPRCIQYVLRHYGQDADLIDLVKEVQWPNLEAGATLAAVETALNKRGIHTQAISITAGGRLQWPHPVVLHVRGDGDLGHFVVWLGRTEAGADVVWDGLSGSQTGPWDKLYTHCTGTALLTAPAPIDCPQDAVERMASPMATACVAVAGLLGIVAVVRTARMPSSRFGARRLA